jgi:adenosine deaminase
MAIRLSSRPSFPALIRVSVSLASLLISCEMLATAQTPAQTGVPAPRSTPATPNERSTERELEAARGNPADLESFFLRMPKGADLHNHLGGDIYAESLIRQGIDDHLCIEPATPSFVKPPAGEGCAKGQLPSSQASTDQHLYDALVDAFSMRGFVPSTGETGHDHFFGAFLKFAAVDARHEGEWLDEVATRAAAQNEQYVEIMDTPAFAHSAALATEIGWHEDLGQMRDLLLARGLREDVGAARARFDQAEASRKQLEHCESGFPRSEPSACGVKIRVLYQILRGYPKEQVFAQTLLGFETAAADPRVVGINYVMPEDGYTAMSDYALHMRIVGFLHALYPKVHITLHAGELAPGLVPYEDLCCHIRLAVEQAHAERIGHGVDVMYEDHPFELLREMAARHVLVEINLSSNDVILGVTGTAHPLPLYRKFGVPVALSTDDEGVSRINLTHEYVRAAETYHLQYADFKRMVRDSLEHSFLPGESLWAAPEKFATPVPACAQTALGAAERPARCAAFLAQSEKAREQWELERRLGVFESRR